MSALPNQLSPDCTIVTTRIMKASITMVYTAWTDPLHLKKWWGPLGFTNTFLEYDCKPGGKWKFIMHGPDKGNYTNECEFKMVQPPTFLSWKRISQPLFDVEVNFEQIGDNHTNLTFTMIFSSEEACNKLKRYVVDKNEENFDKLEQELELMQH